MKRREFFMTLSGFVLGSISKSCTSNNARKTIQLGCFNRPWNKLTFEQALDGIKDAGYEGLGLFGSPNHLIINSETAERDGELLNDLLIQRNLKLMSYSPRFNLSSSPKEITESHIPIMKALQKIGCPQILVMGTNRKELYSKYYELMRYYSEAAQKHNVQVVMKMHGGISSSGELCVEAVQKVGSENFRICYDPGNAFYYDGYDPVEELKDAIDYITAMCVKDYQLRVSQKPDVMITPGDGEVNFEEIFRILKKNNYSGTCIVECLSGTTVEEINYQAKRAFDYISGLIW